MLYFKTAKNPLIFSDRNIRGKAKGILRNETNFLSLCRLLTRKPWPHNVSKPLVSGMGMHVSVCICAETASFVICVMDMYRCMECSA